MGDRLGELEGVAVVLVTFTAQRNLRGYRARLALPYPVLADEARVTYRAYGLGRGPLWRVWGPATVRAYARLVRRGAQMHRPSEDTLQLGGDFVVGPDGRLVYCYRSRSPADRPPVDELVAAADRSRDA